MEDRIEWYKIQKYGLPNFAVASIFLILGLIMISKNASGGTLLKPELGQQILLKNKSGSMMDPRTIAKTMDGGFIVAGSSQAVKSGWVIKTDANGKLLWSYERLVADVSKSGEHETIYNRKNTFGIFPKYSSAAAMSDGSIYLCGDMPNPKANPNQPNLLGMLTRLNANGKLINEQFMTPNGANYKWNSFYDCIAWQDGIVIVGSTSKPIPVIDSKMDYQKREVYYWVMALDVNGKKKWESLIPALSKDVQANWSPPESLPYKTNYAPNQSLQASDVEEGTVLLSIGRNIVFSATDGVMSELISLDAQGRLIAQKKLNGRFRLAHPIIDDSQLQAFGSFFSGNQSPHSLLFLNEKLELVRQVQSESAFNFLVRQIYRLPDQSLMLFGSNINRFSNGYTAGVIHVDNELKNTKKIDLEKSGYLGGSSIYAASLSQKPSEFVIARSLSTENGESSPDGSEAGFIRGAVINFIRL